MPPRRTRQAAAAEAAPKSPSPEPEAVEEPPAKRAKKMTTVTVAEEAEEEAHVETEGVQDNSPDTTPVEDESKDTPKAGDEEETEEWDPSEERLPGETGKKGKGKEKAQDEPSAGEDQAEGGDTKGWQAVWAPEQNAYYFWNSNSGEVTWTNPLAPPPLPRDASQPPLPNEPPPLPAGPAPTVSAPVSAAPDVDPHNQFGQLPEIDPALALLLPPSQRGNAGAPGGADAHLVQQATFNARTGRFTPLDYQYTVGHLDEYNRAKRMNSHYFDVEAWERQKAEESERKAREEANGGRKMTTTRKDMDRYRKKAAEKKQRNQAWLRD
ncbi:hypothetical protein L202_01623 [Cryptococcus amylolentus CBS 6039]|uniref:WW domain-containing protein n=2 Tax=Cryptococcus amylolentus TaxID=104669 RepID=A0A1E3I4N7_9TREE|nr:hypothetical protein L202_01623 [Cryptococcus amylolentus CBS 6039]ODN83487.1 hypothetical protein L202_01623 [Cryptococcus amylolentus CBS 6039]ODO11004.1 hypothetical protein I350_01604 [Cryptococcus amylolentus CBS 6273]